VDSCIEKVKVDSDIGENDEGGFLKFAEGQKEGQFGNLFLTNYLEGV